MQGKYPTSKFNEIKKEGISNDIIENYFRDQLNMEPNIVYISKMDNINTIEDIFKKNDYAVIHVATTTPYTGHWQLIMKDKDNDLFFFDSYGYPFKKLLHSVFERFGYGAHNQTWKFSEIIVNSGLKTYTNKYKYQSSNASNESCGYHILAAYSCFKGLQIDNIKFSFEKYKKIMDNYVKCNRLKNYDDAVIEIFSVKE